MFVFFPETLKKFIQVTLSFIAVDVSSNLGKTTEG